MTQLDADRRDEATSRTIAFVNYGLLFAGIFFAGVPAVIAVVIAYAQRDAATPLIRSHHNFQIRVFWIAFAITLAAGVCFLGAVVNLVRVLVELAQMQSWNGFEGVHLDLSQLSLHPVMVGLLLGSLGLTALAALWLTAAPAFGLIRLASDRPISQERRS